MEQGKNVKFGNWQLTDEYIHLSDLNLPEEILPSGSKMFSYGGFYVLLRKNQLSILIESDVEYRAMLLYRDCLVDELGFTLENEYGLTDMIQTYSYNGNTFCLEYDSYVDEMIFFNVHFENEKIPKCYFEVASYLQNIDVAKFK